MDIPLGILNLIWQCISSLSVIVTIFCFVYPEGAYPIISVVFKKIKERRLKKSKLNITLIYDYNCDVVSLNNYKKDIDSLFKHYGLISEQKGHLIKGNLKRRNFPIYSKFRIPLDGESELHFTQSVNVPFEKFDDCIYSLFDNVRELLKLSYISDLNDGANIRIKTSFFNKNKIVELLGPKIIGNFSIITKNEETILVYNGALIGESIDSLKEIIIALADF